MNDSNPDELRDDEPKIIVDEDWKSQVQAEKETASEQESPPAGGEDDRRIPDASFPMLVTTLATQATVALGQAVSPDAEEVPVDLDLAKHLIDTLAVLQEKTNGNLSEEESGMLTSVLHQLRMLFVGIQSQLKEQPEKKSSIELP